MQTSRPRLLSVELRGYRPFAELRATLAPLQVVLGPCGSGKTSLLEFLRLLRDGLHAEFSPQILPGSGAVGLFHRPGEARLLWRLELWTSREVELVYSGELLGPVERLAIASETIGHESGPSGWEHAPELILERKGREVSLVQLAPDGLARVVRSIRVRPNQLAPGTLPVSLFPGPMLVSELLGLARFYAARGLDERKLRLPAALEPAPRLREDGGNLGAVLYGLEREAPEAFARLEQMLRRAVPGFEALLVRQHGAPPSAAAQVGWREAGVEGELSLADLSDATLRLLCWGAVCVAPEPPPLVGLDEPDQGLDPLALEALAELLREASGRMQILIATPSPAFAEHFPRSCLGVLSKRGGQSVWCRLDG